MPAIVYINDFLEDQAEGVHNLGSDALMIALSNTAPTAEASNPSASGNGVLSNVTQISYANYSDDMTVDRRLQGVTSTESGGVYTLDASDVTVTAVGGALPPFRWVYFYNDTPAGDPLIICMDFDTPISLAVGDSVILRWHASGILYNRNNV